MNYTVTLTAEEYAILCQILQRFKPDNCELNKEENENKSSETEMKPASTESSPNFIQLLTKMRDECWDIVEGDAT